MDFWMSELEIVSDELSIFEMSFNDLLSGDEEQGRSENSSVEEFNEQKVERDLDCRLLPNDVREHLDSLT